MNIDQFEGEEEQEPNKEMKIKLLDQLIEDIMALPDAPSSEKMPAEMNPEKLQAQEG